MHTIAMDRASFIGLLLGIAAILGGNLLEGGRIDSIIQPTAALIVFGGTAGATLLSFPIRDVFKALSALRLVLFHRRIDGNEDLIADIVRISNMARRSGFIAVEPEIRNLEHPFFRRALSLAVAGMLPKLLVETMEQDTSTFEDQNRRISRVYETAGGFAPTIGILGAVLGLIHVMENLSDPSKLGAGIAVAFVATIYGVGSANLVLLPIARKLQNRLQQELALRAMILEGVMGIQSGINPRYLEARLKTFMEDLRSGNDA
ncbi:MAG TPA: flagellar motor protein [Nitrospirota bacterium]|nr:flagellar motor protein [Nitrospirota bacterium]